MFTISADGYGAEKQLENRQQTSRNISLNAERTSAVYLSGRDELRLLDLSNFTTKLLVKDEMWGLYNPVPYFSPDGKHVVFTVIRAFEQDIMIHHLETGETTNLTQSGFRPTDC